MEELLQEGCSKLPSKKIDIFCLQILAEKMIKDTPVLFNISGGREIPMDICIKPCPLPEDIEKSAAETLISKSRKLQELIDNNAPTEILLKVNEDLAALICSLKTREKCCEIKCIDSIKFICMKTNEDFICNHKVRLVIKFKILLILRTMDCCLGMLMLPDDEGVKFCFNNTSFPVIHSSEGIKKILDIDSMEKQFILTIDIPLKKFNGALPPDIFEDPTLCSKIKLKNLQHEFDIFEGTCSCSRNTGTHISLLSKADIIDKIGVSQDVWINAIPEEG